MTVAEMKKFYVRTILGDMEKFYGKTENSTSKVMIPEFWNAYEKWSEAVVRPRTCSKATETIPKV